MHFADSGYNEADLTFLRSVFASCKKVLGITDHPTCAVSRAHVARLIIRWHKAGVRDAMRLEKLVTVQFRNGGLITKNPVPSYERRSRI